MTKRIRRKFSGAFKAQVGLEALKGVKTINQIDAEYEIQPVLGCGWRRNWARMQGMRRRHLQRFLLMCLLVAMGCGIHAQESERSSANDAVLREYFRKYPEADTDGDGTLGFWEYEAHLPPEFFKDIGGRREHRMLAMRDGVRLATEIFLPEGEAKRPTVLIRTGYGRLTVGRYAAKWIAEGCVVVTQDPRGDGASEGTEALRDSNRFEHEIVDTYDTIDWISGQPWSNGRVGTVGGSGHGMPATLGKWNGHPAFVYSATGNSVSHWMHWQFHNGVRRNTYSWLNSFSRRFASTTPTTMPWDWTSWREEIKAWAAEQQFVYTMGGGWYDPFLESDLQAYSALQDSGRAFVTIAPRGHGGISGLRPTPKATIHPQHRNGASPPNMLDVLRNGLPEAGESQLRYYLMGDVKDPAAPGNVRRNTREWPVAHEDIAWYPGADKGLTTATATESEWRFEYDPNDPAPSLGGHYAWSGDVSGPWDQRPLLERGDVLLFQSEPLDSPFIITGPMQARVVFSTDVEDTTIVVKLVDIYPDGYHALVKESAAMGRYYQGWAHAGKALEAGKRYGLEMDLGSTAYAFASGHRLAVIVTSSSAPAYQVHPNRFGPTASLENAPVATTTIYCGPGATRIVLPRVDDDGR